MVISTRALSSIICSLALLIMSTSTQASLINNGGFEDGLNGWECTYLDGACSTASSSIPQEGDSHFIGYDTTGVGSLRQSVITEIGTEYEVSFYYGSSILSPENNLSLMYGRGMYGPTLEILSTWNYYSHSFIAEYAYSEFDFNFATGYGTGDILLDDIKFVKVSVPSPSTSILFVIGLCVLGFIRRKLN